MKLQLWSSFFCGQGLWTKWYTLNQRLTSNPTINCLTSLEAAQCRATVCLGSTNIWPLCWGLHGGTTSLMVKTVQRHTLYVPECMALKLHRARYVFFHPQISNTNFNKQDLYLWEIGRVGWEKTEARNPIFTDFHIWSPPLKNSNWHDFVNIGI